MLADEVDDVIGVDTHRDQHTLAVVVAPTGAVLAQTVVRATGRGYAHALRFAESHAGGVRAWAIEGAGHYGAGLTRYLADRGETVLEVGRHARTERRRLCPTCCTNPASARSSPAQLIVTWSHTDRVRSEAAFARLAGVAPLPASSGQTIRHRLSRGGDRQLNRALHTVVLHRRQHDAATRDYIAHRVAEGQDNPRSDPRPQALPRSPPLPRHAERRAADDLTVIRDSFPRTGAADVALAQPGQRFDPGMTRAQFRLDSMPESASAAARQAMRGRSCLLLDPDCASRARTPRSVRTGSSR